MEVKVDDEKLNKAAMQYAKESDDYGDLFSLLYNTFVAGAEWQQEQTTKAKSNEQK